NPAPTFDEVAAFVPEETGQQHICPSSELGKHIRIWGDDYWELINAYSKKFNVDVSGFLWYFHSVEEGHNIGGLFFRPPNRYVTQIPVTVGMLHDFAVKGRWDLAYPNHWVPPDRRDLRFNLVLALLIAWVAIVVGIYSCISRWVQ